MKTLTLLSFLLVTVSSFASGQSSSSVHEPSLSTELNLSYYTDFHKSESEEHEASLLFFVAPHFHLNDTWSFDAHVSALKELTHEKHAEIEDASVGMTIFLGNINEDITVKNDYRVYIPTNESLLKDRKMRAKIETGVVFKWTLGGLLSGLSLSYRPWVARGIFKFQNSVVTGEANPRWTAGQRFAGTYDFTDRFSFSGQLGYIYSWSYGDNRMQDAFFAEQTFSYRLDGDVEIAVGHVNRGQALRANGQSNNVSLFDRDESRVYSSLSTEF